MFGVLDVVFAPLCPKTGPNPFAAAAVTLRFPFLGAANELLTPLRRLFRRRRLRRLLARRRLASRPRLRSESAIYTLAPRPEIVKEIPFALRPQPLAAARRPFTFDACKAASGP